MTDLISLLQTWVPRQRWYVGGIEGDARLRLVGSYSLSDPDFDRSVRFITVAMLYDETDGGSGQLYQVPLVIRDVDGAIDARGYVGTYDTGNGAAAVVDGPHDPAFARAILSLIEREQVATGPGGQNDAVAFGLPMPGSRAGRVHSSRALQGEQSNSSIVLEMRSRDDDAESAPLIVKIFRTLHHGENPDVTLQSALASAGCLRVPPALGQVTGEWPDPSQPGGRARGHLAFAQEFFAGVEDAWRVARRAAETGEEFAASARSLGEATAETHGVLREHLPNRPAEPTDIAAAITAMRGRLAQAADLVPEIAELRDRIEHVYAGAAYATWPHLQRIHGDYHLGQVLAVPERGWVLLDFEGEPLRPLADRNALDVPARDVAGMLRSFDYVAGSLALAAGHDVANEWAATARNAFLRGYTERFMADAQTSGSLDGALDPKLVAAYELDKAVYEAIYESSHRPDWLPIPVAAVRRLLGLPAAEATGDSDAAPAGDGAPVGERSRSGDGFAAADDGPAPAGSAGDGTTGDRLAGDGQHPTG